MVYKIICFYILLLSYVIADITDNIFPVFSEKGTRYLESIGELNRTEYIKNKIEKRDKSMQINFYSNSDCSGGGTEWNAYRNGNNVNCNNNGGLGVRSLRCASR